MNNANPKQAYFRADGNFEFALPEGAQFSRLRLGGRLECRWCNRRSTRRRIGTRSRLRFVRAKAACGIRMRLPYAGNTASIKLPTVYPDAKLLVLGAPTLQIRRRRTQAERARAGNEDLRSRARSQRAALQRQRFGNGASPNARGGGDAEGGGQQDRAGRQQSQVTVTQIPGTAGCVEVAAGRWISRVVRARSDFAGSEAGRGSCRCSWR